MKGGMVVGPRSVARHGFRCGCCTLNGTRDGRGKDAERRQVKRADRQAWKRAVDNRRGEV